MRHLLFIYFLFLNITIFEGEAMASNHNGSKIYIKPTSTVNRPAYYKAMQGDNKELVNAQLSELNGGSETVRDAFIGAMTMKKAGLGGSPITKLHLFKVGHKMLEAAIIKDPNNAEFRFLRLMIQEHAPGILGYKNEINTDSEYIKKMYKTLPDDVQHAITDYSKKSKYLKLGVS